MLSQYLFFMLSNIADTVNKHTMTMAGNMIIFNIIFPSSNGNYCVELKYKSRRPKYGPMFVISYNFH